MLCTLLKFLFGTLQRTEAEPPSTFCVVAFLQDKQGFVYNPTFFPFQRVLGLQCLLSHSYRQFFSAFRQVSIVGLQHQDLPQEHTHFHSN